MARTPTTLKQEEKKYEPYIMLTLEEAILCHEAVKNHVPTSRWLIKGMKVDALAAKLEKQIKERQDGVSTANPTVAKS